MQFQFHYRRNNTHVVQLVLLSIFSLLLLGVGLIALQQMAKAPNSTDKQLFIWLPVGFGATGFGFLLFSITYYLRMAAFYKSNNWYGITLSNGLLTCKQFDVFRVKPWSVKASAVETVTERFYKGKRLLELKTAGKKYFLPASLLSQNDYGQLLAALQSHSARP